MELEKRRRAVVQGSSGTGSMTGFVVFGLTLLGLGCAHQSVLPRAQELEVAADYAAQPEVAALTGSDTAPVLELCELSGGSSLASAQEELIAGNYDLAAALARFENADARAREVGASLLPRLDVQLNVNRNPAGAFGAAIGLPGLSNSPITTYQPSLAASWEIDLWGRLKRNRRAALADAGASFEDLRGLSVTLSSTLADLWFGEQSELQLLALLDEQVAASERFLELVSLRFGQGFGAAQDIGRQKDQILALTSQYEQARGRLRALQVQRAALLGRTEIDLAGVLRGGRGDVDQVAAPLMTELNRPVPEVGVPLELLEMRPDVRAAYARLQAADDRLAAAVRERLPTLRLTLNMFDFQRELSELFETVFWQLIGTASESIYQGGARKARIDQAAALAEEALANYSQAVIAAVSEVHGALVALESQERALRVLNERLDESARVLDLTRTSYREGATDYLNVITALQAQQNVEQQIVQAMRDQVANRVQVCRTVGLPSGLSVADLERPLLERALAGRLSASSSSAPDPTRAAPPAAEEE